MEVIKDLAKLKEERGYSYAFLSERCGIEAGTLQKIMTGQTKHPRQKTIEALIEVYSSLYRQTDYIVRFDADKGLEDELQGKYTVADWENLPDNMRLELIDGVFYDMGQPSVKHQVIVQEIASAFRDYVKSNNGRCLPVISPIGVQIDRDDKTMLEPDMIVVCDPDRFRETAGKWLAGEPDFVLEVLSPSSRKRDMTIKLHKYEKAGVREYWIIDPDRETLIVYEFAAEVTPTLYSFSDCVPVAIYEGRFSIDLSQIKDTISMYEQWKS